MMGHILHDWNLAEKKQLVRKAYEALPAGGAMIVYDAIIDDERQHNAFGLLMSLNMLIETPGGFDYTGAGAPWFGRRYSPAVAQLGRCPPPGFAPRSTQLAAALSRF